MHLIYTNASTVDKQYNSRCISVYGLRDCGSLKVLKTGTDTLCQTFKYHTFEKFHTSLKDVNVEEK